MIDPVLLPWIMLPIVGAVIGYATNWLAIKMLFHPRQPRFGLQGLLPRRQEELANSVARIVAEELLSPDHLLAKLDGVDLSPAFSRLADRALERRVEDLRKIPLIGGFITAERLSTIRDALVDELRKAQPSIINELKSMAGASIDVYAIVRDRLMGFDLMQMERLVHQVARKEFRAIEIWGAVLGTLIGLAQAGLLALVQG
ncbi:MAG: DUF445 family protein [Planctomycetota bacterium]|nr:MAG: DUF445 family protein [Planctomycetota bacterium]